MDKCQKCGQTICQPGYRERLGVYTCTDCMKNERKAKFFAMYGWFWSVWLLWNNLLNKVTVWQLIATEPFANFAHSLSNEVGEFTLRRDRESLSLGVNINYTNRGGVIEVCVWGTKGGDDPTMIFVFDKFKAKLVKFITINGENAKVKKFTKSMTELLKSGVEFEEKLCHC